MSRDHIRVRCETCSQFYDKADCICHIETPRFFFCPNDGERCYEMGETDTGREEELNGFESEIEALTEELETVKFNYRKLKTQYDSDWNINQKEN